MTDPSTLDRAMTSLRRLIRNEDPTRTWQAIYEYRVTSFDGLYVSGVPTDTTNTPPLPNGVPYTPSLGSATATIPDGTLCYVFFANGDPTRPRVMAFASPSGGPVSAGETVGSGSDTGRVVRYGDSVTIGLATGPVAQATPGVAPISRVSA